jgi:uncharacterized protein (TIGR02270 family)
MYSDASTASGIESPEPMNSTPVTRPVVDVVRQHVEDAAILYANRSSLLAAPHARLINLRRFDDRLAAHLDGLAVAGTGSWALCEEALELLTQGALFTMTIRAIGERRQEYLQRLFALAQTDADASPGLIAAFGWSEAADLRGIVPALLSASDPYQKHVGIACSAMHRVDPGLLSARWLENPDLPVRARALRTAGELGKRESMSALNAALDDESPVARFWAAWAAVLLGDRHNALDCLKADAVAQGPLQPRAFQLALQAMSIADSHAMLQQLAADPINARLLVQGAGFSGDPTYVPWLIGHMADDKLARIAGESFCMIAGTDLAELDLERDPPDEMQAGPNDDPEDDTVDMDADEDLPWPDQTLVQAWWAKHGPRFTPGVRHFVGAPLSRNHCIDVLRNGYQRQRIAAAYHLCLLNPGTPLFEWRAPAWRQQRELAQLA